MLRVGALLLILLTAVCPDRAAAGAWTREEGDGLFIFSSGRQVAPVSAFASGLSEEDSNTTQVLVEYGLFDDLTLGATLFADISTNDISDGTLSAGLFARKRLWQGEASLISAQLGYAHPLEELVSDAFDASSIDSAPEIEMRLLYGHSLWGDWGSAFASVETGYDLFLEDREDEIRADLTLGYQPWRCCLFLMSTFGTLPTGDDDPSFKIAPSFAYTLWPDIDRNAKKPEGPVRPRTIQIGINYDLLNSDDGLGIQVSVWRRF
ncbi:MAG: hypothetical protein AAGH74_10525 [Pseudomonadota bacterium]